jgi:paraquat-inducible protein A
MSLGAMVGPHPNSLAARARGPDRLLGWVVLFAGVLLVLGWTLPIMTVEKLWFLSERVSILQGALELWRHGDLFLCAVIVIFSVAFPLLKLGLALFLWYQADTGGALLVRALGWIEQLGRWSMLDVFVVALLVVAIQASLISDVAMHAGIYVFTAAVVVSILAVQRMTALARRARAVDRS